jgi:hypothetical protein
LFCLYLIKNDNVMVVVVSMLMLNGMMFNK